MASNDRLLYEMTSKTLLLSFKAPTPERVIVNSYLFVKNVLLNNSLSS